MICNKQQQVTSIENLAMLNIVYDNIVFFYAKSNDFFFNFLGQLLKNCGRIKLNA